MGLSKQLILNSLSQIVPFGLNIYIVNLIGFDSFGEYAFYSSFYFITAVLVTLRLEHTFFSLNNNLNEALNNSISTIVYVSIFLILIISIYCFIKEDYNYLISIIIGAQVGFYEVFKNYLIRKNKLSLVTISRFINATIPLLLIIVLNKVFEPILSHFIGTLIITFIYIFYLKEVQIIKIKALIIFLKKNKKFIQFSLPSGLISVISGQLPILLTKSIFGEYYTGILSFLIRILGAPISLVSLTILDFFKNEGHNEIKLTKAIKHTFIKYSKILFFASVFIFVGFLVFKDFGFKLLLKNGLNIEDVLTYSKILIFLFCIRLTVSPLSYIIFMLEKQELDLYWQILNIVFVLFSFLAFTTFKDSIISYTVLGIFSYIIYYYQLKKISKN